MTDVATAAKALLAARAERKPIAPVSQSYSVQTAVDAYAVQELQTDAGLSDGRILSGRKIGLTSKAVQAQLGVDEPDYGMLFADMAFEDGDIVPSTKLIQPRGETEVAIVMSKDMLDPNVSLTELIRGIDYLLPAVEIVDSAIIDWKISLVDTIADNASSGLYVIGKTPISPHAVDLEMVGMVTRNNGSVVSTGVGAACLGHPLSSALWLARMMVKVGRPLLGGDIVLTGALGPMFPLAGNDQIDARIAGLGSVRFTMSAN